jgi:hypothetical protein
MPIFFAALVLVFGFGETVLAEANCIPPPPKGSILQTPLAAGERLCKPDELPKTDTSNTTMRYSLSPQGSAPGAYRFDKITGQISLCWPQGERGNYSLKCTLWVK